LATSVASSVKSFVENGGAFLGLRAGMQTGGALGGVGLEYSFRLQDSSSGSSLYCTFPTAEDSEAQITTVHLDNEEAGSLLYKTNESNFEGIDHSQIARVLARHSDSGKIAAAVAKVGGGTIALWGPHLESSISLENSELSPEETARAERRRQAMICATLNALGLRLPPPDSSNPPRPLPQFLLSSRPGVVSHILGALSVTLPSKFQDDHDTFVFHDASDEEALLQQSRQASDTDGLRHVIAHVDTSCPVPHLTPLFNTKDYFATLSLVRNRPPESTSVNTWSMGDVLFYGEAVSSTQTLLDK
jgi:biotin---protein ligase